VSAFIAILVGFILWAPVIILLGGLGGTVGNGLSGCEALATIGPVFLISGSSIMRSIARQRLTSAAWSFAWSPSWALLGGAGMAFFQASVFANLRVSHQEMAASFLVFFLACGIAYLRHRNANECAA
jgi:hypothetical protein